MSSNNIDRTVLDIYLRWARTLAEQHKDVPALQDHYRRITELLEELFRTRDNQFSYQHRVHEWMMECFGPEIAADTRERGHRFLEEALEMVQAGNITESEAIQIVRYVYGRPVGELKQEVGGVRVTLAAFCTAYNIDHEIAGEIELSRCWTKIPTIRAKQAAKPKHSPLPEAVSPPQTAVVVTVNGDGEATEVRYNGEVVWTCGKLAAVALRHALAEYQALEKSMETDMKFYNVVTLEGLLKAQQHYILKLQHTLKSQSPEDPARVPQVREG